MEPHRRGRRRHSLENAARGQHHPDGTQRRQLRHFAGYSKVGARLIPACALRRRDALFSRRVLQAKVSENRAQMIAKSQKPWVPGSLDPKPPAPPVKPPWQAPPLPTETSPRLSVLSRPFFSRLNPSSQPVPVIRKTETMSRDGEALSRTHPGPANLGERFRHAFLADPIHDRRVKPPSLPKPSNRFAPDLAR